MTFYKRLCDAKGTPTPEIDAMMSNDPRQCTTLEPVTIRSSVGPTVRATQRRVSPSRDDYPFEMRRPSGPTPFEVFAWFHGLIPAKLYRALLCSNAISRGNESRKDEEQASAKVALIGIDRSLDALAVDGCGR